MLDLEKLRAIGSEPSGEAKALPFACYTSSEIYEQEQANIFHSDWVFVCAEKELPNEGDYFAFVLAGEPLVIVRDQEGNLLALSNVCRHRGTIINDKGFGNCKRFVCPYHAWTYDHAGQLVAVPFPGGAEIDKSSHCLPRFGLSVWEGLVFVNLDANAADVGARLQGIKPYLQKFQTERFKYAHSGDTEHWRSNWKLVMENAMESYHLFKVHKDTLEKVTPTKQAYYLEGSAHWTLTGGKMLGVTNKLWKWLDPVESEKYEHYVLISIPPSFVGILTYESLEWISVLPVNETECEVRSAGISQHDGDESKDVTQFTQAFFAEDQFICERVQQGMQSRYSKGGKLVELERVVVDFHQYFTSRLFGTKPDPHFVSSEAERFFDEFIS